LERHGHRIARERDGDCRRELHARGPLRRDRAPRNGSI
jgi:hypothetical protein